jgi:cytochrome bd ubiquinol oxidase subunit II
VLVFGWDRVSRKMHFFSTWMVFVGSVFSAVWIVPVLNVLAIANIPRAIHRSKPLYAFLSSSATVAALASLFAAAIFPNFVVSTVDPAYSVNIFNARSSEITLGIMLMVALIGMPCVLSYTVAIYWTFRGKVNLDRMRC